MAGFNFRILVPRILALAKSDFKIRGHKDIGTSERFVKNISGSAAVWKSVADKDFNGIPNEKIETGKDKGPSNKNILLVGGIIVVFFTLLYLAPNYVENGKKDKENGKDAKKSEKKKTE